jgi:hypothetical protein
MTSMDAGASVMGSRASSAMALADRPIHASSNAAGIDQLRNAVKIIPMPASPVSGAGIGEQASDDR